MVEFTEFERAKGNGQYETMVPLDEARAEIERLEKEVEALKAGRDMLGNFWDKAKQEVDTAWNDAIEAAAKCTGNSVIRGSIRALKRRQP